MIKKIFFHLIFLSFLFIGEAFASESGGMPQLNPEFWISQIFWLIITFGILYVLLSKLVLPKISNNLEIRKSQILENIEAAEKQREDSDEKIKQYEEIIREAKVESKNYFNETREEILQSISKKKDILNTQLDNEIKESEIEVQDFMDKAPEKVNKIAIEASKDLIHKLIGVEVNNSSLSAIVEDLSMRDKDKYYGN